MQILNFISCEPIVWANSALARRNYRWIHQTIRGEALTSACFIRGMGREARNAVGNTKITLQKEPMVTEVTSVSVAALQTPLRAGYQREDMLSEAKQRHWHPTRATSDRERKSESTRNTWSSTAAKDNSNSFLRSFIQIWSILRRWGGACLLYTLWSDCLKS